MTRASNNFGPWQFPEKVIPLFLTNLLDGQNVPLYGDGLNEREWLFVEDHCAAIDVVLRAGKEGEIYNIGAGSGLTNRDLTDKLLALAAAGPERVDYVTDRLGHDRRYCIDSSKIARPRLGAGARPRRRSETDLCLVQGQPLVVGALEKERAG